MTQRKKRAASFGRVSNAVRTQRLQTCKTCPHMKRMAIQLCGLCGCPITNKTLLARASCPIGKW